MPNDVTTRCTVTGPAEDAAAFRERMIVPGVDTRGGRSTVFNFRNIIPEPVIFHQIEEWSDSAWGARLRAKAISETGYGDCFSWRIANWGTKWNAHSFRLCSDAPLEFRIETAWDFPKPVFATLAREFPTLQFKCLTFDECWCFGGQGFFNPPAGEHEWAECRPTGALFERVFYGESEDCNACEDPFSISPDVQRVSVTWTTPMTEPECESEIDRLAERHPDYDELLVEARSPQSKEIVARLYLRFREPFTADRHEGDELELAPQRMDVYHIDKSCAAYALKNFNNCFSGMNFDLWLSCSKRHKRELHDDLCRKSGGSVDPHASARPLLSSWQLATEGVQANC